MYIMLRLLLVFLFICLSEATHSRWLNFACTENGTISGVNPQPERFTNVTAFSNSGAVCESYLINNYNTIIIKDCGAEIYRVAVVLSTAAVRDTGVIGGRGAETYFASCNLKKAYYRVAIVKFIAELDKSNLGSDSAPDLDKELIKIEPTLMDLYQEPGFYMFSIGYPITVRLSGPANTSIKATTCIAYPGTNVNKTSRVKQTLIYGGCSTISDLIFNFTDKWMLFYDRNVPGFDPNLILTEDMFLAERGSDSGEPSIPELWTHMFSFRFFSSRTVTVVCDVKVCKPGHSDCDPGCSHTPGVNADAKKRSVQERGSQSIHNSRERQTQYSMMSYMRQQQIAQRQPRSPEYSDLEVEERNEEASRAKRRVEWKPRPIVGGADLGEDPRTTGPPPPPNIDMIEVDELKHLSDDEEDDDDDDDDDDDGLDDSKKLFNNSETSASFQDLLDITDEEDADDDDDDEEAY